MDGGVCNNCKEQGHHAEKCPDLWAPLKEGFYTGGGGGIGGGGEDEHLAAEAAIGDQQQYYRALNKDDRIRRFFIHVDILSNPDCSGVHSHVLQEFQVPRFTDKIRC